MDGDGEFKIPVKNGKHLKYNIIGINFKNYDSIINLAHGKAYIHSCGQTEDPNLLKERVDRQVGRHILPYAESLGLGSTKYELIDIDEN